MKLPDVDTMANNLVEAFADCSEQHITQGLNWYTDAQEFAAYLASLAPQIDFQKAAGVIAVTSPKQNWDQQKQALPKIIHHLVNGDISKACFGFSRNLHKAARVCAGDMTAITGPKVSAFYAAICGDTNAVTVDRHALRAAVGQYVAEEDHQCSPCQYPKVKQAYEKAAQICGFSPRDFQAIIWCYTKERLAKAARTN